MTSMLGVVAGLLATRSSAKHIVAGAIGIAVAATIGMGAGQYLSDDQRNLRTTVVMALATLIGSVLPAVPFFSAPRRRRWSPRSWSRCWRER
jgi:VIT1/CCC1 family predicted Fe2+/Mn2+ transporter